VSRVAIVTGAARGIGAATVDALVNENYRVVAVDRCRDIADVPYALATKVDLDAVVARHGEVVLGLVGDVRSATDMQLASRRRHDTLDDWTPWSRVPACSELADRSGR